jgi:hypothetical protein
VSVQDYRAGWARVIAQARKIFLAMLARVDERLDRSLGAERNLAVLH